MSILTTTVVKNQLGDYQAKAKAEAVVARNTFALEAETKAQIVAFDFIESGDTLNSVLGTPDGLQGEVTVGTEQAVYGNYGTDKMAARPFADQAAAVIWPKFVEEMGEAMRG
jgi:hypothetical protein